MLVQLENGQFVLIRRVTMIAPTRKLAIFYHKNFFLGGKSQLFYGSKDARKRWNGVAPTGPPEKFFRRLFVVGSSKLRIAA
jgi:hypothetical protein